MKYINSDMLRHLFEVWKEIEEKAGNDKGAYCYNECINALDKMPSDNVVEIVRCKNCKNSVCIGERYFCDIQYDEWGQPYVVKPDGFCDVGERKENNE